MTHDQPVWHALDRTAVEAALGTSPHGLGPVEAAARLRRHGPNAIEEEPPPSALVVLLHQFRSPLIYILLLAAAVTMLLGEWIDAGVIAAVLALNAVIGFTQERGADRSVRALRSLVAPHARVLRDGREHDVESQQLVPGDLVLLESGVRVPADLRLVAATTLMIDESLLTGESTSVEKTTRATPPEAPLADRTGMAYAGSVVAAGRGRGYVVATGTHTELGAIARQVRGEDTPDTPLQVRMARFARVVGIAVGVASVAAFGLGIVMGQSPGDMFLLAVALAVAAIPEGLPVVFTITLALGVRRMARRNAITRRLPAVETLGSTTVIGSDKTGTLTENRMTVQAVWAAGRTVTLGADGDEGAWTMELAEHRPIYLTLLAGVLANEATLHRGDHGFELQGDPTEAALLVAAARLGVEPAEVRAAHAVDAEIPFESERQYSACLCTRAGEHFVFVKGAPERVLDMSTQALGEDGPVPVDRAAVLAAAGALAAQGLRLLGFAFAKLPHPPESGEPVPAPEQLTFLGLQGMMDPPRAGVADAIRGCRDAGIRVVMITGDHADTARAIGQQLGLVEGTPRVVTGVELDTMDDAALAGAVREVPIYARVAPEHKLRVVQALRAGGEVVAVTGDGVNDAPALKAADIGIAMGRSGTDVAREAADMVLADDNFVSIYAAVEEGRVTFENVRKVTFFLISTGAASVVTLLTSLALGWPLPMLPAQLLWLNLVTNGLQDVALAFEPGESHLLRRPPRPRNEGVISRLLWERTVIAGLVMAAGTLLLFRWELDQSGSLAQAQTVALSTMVIFQVFHVGNCRSEGESVLRRSPFSNPFLLIATIGSLGIHVASLYLAPTQFVLRVVPIPLETWIRIVAVAASILVAMEVHKLVRHR